MALDPTVLEWIERYEENESEAMTELVNFILRVYTLSTNLTDVVLRLYV